MMWFKKSLRSLAGSGILLGCAAALAWSVPGFADDEKEPKGKPSRDGKGKPEEEEEKKGMGFGAFLPIGLANEGVIIPSFDGGVRTSLIKADVMKRVDEDHLEMDNMVIENFLPDGTVDSKISMLRARYHMPSAVLSSRSRSRIERTDFEVEGDRLVFDTETQRGRMAGNVEMVIFDVKDFGARQGISEEGAAAGEKAAAKPGPETGGAGDE